MDVEIPAHLSHTGAAYTKRVGIDACIAPIVKALNDAGIRTTTSCCGHGRSVGSIAISGQGRASVVLAVDPSVAVTKNASEVAPALFFAHPPKNTQDDPQGDTAQ